MSQIDLIKGIGPKKKLGQNFLIEDSIIQREIAYCDPKDKTILEIGPGIGALTAVLSKQAKSLTAIEIDSRLVPLLKEKFRNNPNTSIIQGDFLEFNGGPYDLVVSNLPYYIASKIIFKLTEIEFTEAILCIQSELAYRATALPNTRDYSRLSVMCSFLFDIEIVDTIPASAFYPKPKVQSKIIRLIKKGSVSDGLAQFINALFQHKNKKLRNAIIDSKKFLKLDGTKVQEIVSKLSLKNRRVKTLTKDEILRSFEEYKRH